MRYISLFTGIGGLDRAIDSLGGDPWVQVEKEPYCRSILDLRYPDVPKVDNIFGWHAQADTVDLVIGGPPCQPVSHAGRRKGQDDERWLWGEALRIVGEAQPERVFFENPMGLRTLGLDTVLDGLTELGYGGAWEVVAAADVGAPHLRKRIFIMGIRGRSGWEGPTRPPGNRKVLWPTPLVGDMHLSSTPEAARRRIAEGKVTLSRAVQSGLWPEPAPTKWPSPTASGERPNEGNVRLLRQRVLDGTMTEDEAKGMLNGKSPFDAQGKVPAHIPTPTARLGGERGPQAKRYFDPARSNDLDDYVAAFPTVAHWPTPGAQDAKWRATPATSARRQDLGRQISLEDAAYLAEANRWPTPTSRDHKDTGDSIANGTVPVNGLLGRAVGPTKAGGALSPNWVEWLMGLPIGWTDVNVPEPGAVESWDQEPDIPRIGLGIANRSKRLTALGNAVVPAQAVFAWQRLSERLG